MAVVPTHDEAPPPDAGAQVALEGTPHGPLATLVVRWDGELVALDLPMAGGRPVRPDPGSKVRISYRVKDVPCALPAVVAEVAGDDVIWCRREGPVLRFQRRLDFRIDDALLARIRSVDPPAPEDEPPAPGVTINLSARGTLVRTRLRPRPGDVLHLELDLPGDEPVRIAGRCVRVTDPVLEGGERDVAIAFDLTVAEEQRLREAVMRLQRRALAKGL